MKNLKEILQFLSKKMDYLREEYKVEKIGVFGSYSQNKMVEISDVDILVEFSEPIDLFNFVKLENYLSEYLGIKVDLVSKKALRSELNDQILRDLIYA